MKKIWLLIILPIGLIFFLFINPNKSDDEYIAKIHAFWKDKHDFFSTSKASPFIEKGVVYKPIEYFEPNPDYKVEGKLDRFTKREITTLSNSDRTTTSYLKYALINFKIDGKKCSLLVLRVLGFGNQYFLAFGDATSANATYGGGRYLEVEIGKSDLVTLDFNKAYNPYCAYFDDFICPLPLKENLLEVAIEAGEKDYNH